MILSSSSRRFVTNAISSSIQCIMSLFLGSARSLLEISIFLSNLSIRSEIFSHCFLSASLMGPTQVTSPVCGLNPDRLGGALGLEWARLWLDNEEFDRPNYVVSEGKRFCFLRIPDAFEILLCSVCR